MSSPKGKRECPPQKGKGSVTPLCAAKGSEGLHP